jgi:peptidoglycan hydrolase CwlO-like protein
MPPLNSAPSSDVDNEVTAELPVLDVAAYEAALNDAAHETAHTDSWAAPGNSMTSAMPVVEPTTEVPAIRVESIPTLTPAPAYDLDHSGTHEMPPLLKHKPKAAPSKSGSSPNKPAVVMVSAASAMPAAPARPAAPKTVHSRPAVMANAPLVSTPIEIPPSPPLIEELRGALARAERRIEELNERARIADAERTVAIGRANAESIQLREQLAAHLEAVVTAKERLGVQGTDQCELQDAYFTRGDRITALERELAAQAQALADMRAQLAASQQRCETLDCDAMNLRATVARRNSHIAMLEADLQSRQQREAALSERLGEALASVDPHVPELRAELSRNNERLRELKAELAELRTRIAEKDSDLEVAEESIRNLETELRNKTSKLEEASVTVEEWRAVIAESQRSILQRDNRIQQLEADLEKRAVYVAPPAADHAGEEIALEGPARVLIRTDGNTDFVHVLGRRTRIGRGSDNELVLDTKHVSRYHAVLLAGPVNTSIEDLNSTNGVFVNGRRITRQVLKDGDRVTIGRTQFRYTVRD